MTDETVVGVVSAQTENDSVNVGMADLADRDFNITEEPLLSLDIAYVTFELFVAVSSTIGNAFVIAVFVKYKSMRSVTNYFVLSLAVADLLVGIVAVPFAIVTSTGLPELFPACLLMNCLIMVLCTSSIFSLVAISVDRYIAIVSPLRYKTSVTSRRSLIIILTSWSLAILVGLLPLFGWNLGEPPEPRCVFLEVMDLTYLLFIYIATIILPSVFIAIVYVKIFRVIQAHLRGLPPVTRTKESKKPAYSEKEARAAKSLSLVVVLFVVSWVPLYTINSVMYFCPDCPIPAWLMKFTIILSHSNSIWNPALYAWGLKGFRAGFTKIICFWRPRRNDTVTSESSSKFSNGTTVNTLAGEGDNLKL